MSVVAGLPKRCLIRVLREVFLAGLRLGAGIRVTYIAFIYLISFSSLFLVNRRVRPELMPLGMIIALMILSFSFSDNYDHQTYIYSLENSLYDLFEPLFYLMMWVYGVSSFDPRFFLFTLFLVVFLIAFRWGDRLFLSTSLVYLAPVGVVSVRYFLAAILIALVINSRSRLASLLPILTHYAAVLPVTAILFGIFSTTVVAALFVIGYRSAPTEIFALVKMLGGIDYSRYLALSNSSNFGYGSFAKYAVLPIVLAILFILSGWRKEHGRILSIFILALCLKIGIDGVEVISRISSILMVIGIYYALSIGNLYARWVVVMYLFSHALVFGFTGWQEHPEVYSQSNSVFHHFIK